MSIILPNQVPFPQEPDLSHIQGGKGKIPQFGQTMQVDLPQFVQMMTAQTFEMFTKAKVKVKIKKMNEDAIIPKYGSVKAGLCDLYAVEDKIVPAGTTAVIGTGIACEPPEGFMLKIRSRSGLASKGIITVGGEIDEDYRGEIKVILLNTSGTDFTIAKGDRIAQMELRRYQQIDFNEVKNLSDTERGNGGLGSTGK